MLRKTIRKSGGLAVAPELLDPTQEGFRRPVFWRAFFDDVWNRYDGWHLQRYQIPEGEAWQTLTEAGPRVINLYRQDTLAQYASWKIAMKVGRWHSRPESDNIPSIPFDREEYNRLSNGWRQKREYCDRIIDGAGLPRLDVVYENFVFDWVNTWAAIAAFLGLSVGEVQPELPKLPEIEYWKVFSGWPG
jgi:hypothetical protein